MTLDSFNHRLRIFELVITNSEHCCCKSYLIIISESLIWWKLIQELYRIFHSFFFSLARIRKRRLKAQTTSTRVEEPIKPAFCRLIESFDTITHSISFIVFSRTNRSVVRAAGQTASSEQETKMQKCIRTIIEDIKYTRFDNTRKSRASEKSSSLEFLSKRKPHRIFRVAKNYRTRWKYIQWDKPHLIINWISTSLYFSASILREPKFLSTV